MAKAKKDGPRRKDGVWDPLKDSSTDRRSAAGVPKTPQSMSPTYRLAYAAEDFLCREELHVTPELSFNFHYFAVRKMHLMMRAKAIIIFPGGFGTMDEMFEALTLIQTRRMERIPFVLFGKEFWNTMVNWQALADFGTIAPEDLELISFVETADEAWKIVADFYEH